ncbi:MAG: ADP-ribose-binding protein [Termitinemataceae bacterium]|nr:MAG: ADP-ribose-binding protein [Termitinemataceae bacterium]
MIIEAIVGDITKQTTDVIVNAANSTLLGGGGVDGAIHAAAGIALVEECYGIPIGPYGRCQTGQAVMTNAYKLPCKKIIHTVGPVYRACDECGEAELLALCYSNSLISADEEGYSSISFPCISTGVYGYPKDKAAKIAVASVRLSLKTAKNINHVVFVCFDNYNYKLYTELLKLDCK